MTNFSFKNWLHNLLTEGASEDALIKEKVGLNDNKAKWSY